MKKKILKLLELCLEINPEQTRQELTGNKPTVMFAFDGHCNWVSIQVFKKGWCKDTYPNYRYDYFNNKWHKNFPNNSSNDTTIVNYGIVLADLERINKNLNNKE